MTSAAPVVTAGSVKFGNALPLAVIAGPCALESRAHAFEMATALKEIATRLGIGLVYKTLVRQGQPHQRRRRARHRAEGGAADLRGYSSAARPAGADRRARAGAMCGRRRSGRHPADPGVPVAPDRSSGCGRAHRQDRQRQEGPVPRAVGHEERRRQGDRRRQRECDGHRARRLVRLQHAGVGHARAADPCAHHRRAGDLRCDPFGAAAGRAGRFVGR